MKREPGTLHYLFSKCKNSPYFLNGEIVALCISSKAKAGARVGLYLQRLTLGFERHPEEGDHNSCRVGSGDKQTLKMLVLASAIIDNSNFLGLVLLSAI